MQKEFQFQADPEVAATPSLLRVVVAKKYGFDISELRHVEIVKRSIDARKKPVKVNLQVMVYLNEEMEAFSPALPDYPDVSGQEQVLIVGAGPAGLFAALQCIAMGKRPLIVERGKDVQARRRDLRAINIDHVVNEDSNYCFGEGGAGTYSDGKLYTRSKKRGDVQEILHLLVGFGASRDILIEAHPHIGTNKLPAIIESMRHFIISHGGLVLFNTRVTDLIIRSGKIAGITTLDGNVIEATRVILATGHSARDIFLMLHRQGVTIEAKPFAMGVRVEHPQALIDSVQYHCDVRGPYLPPAPYSIVRQVDGRGVYSFCMCPGGIIAPCATSPGEVVTNGWSPSKRDQPTANSGIVVELKMGDFSAFDHQGPLAAMFFQQSIEQRAWLEGGKSQKVPAQRLADFVHGKHSRDIPQTSYKPGVTSVELGSVFPQFIHQSLRQGFKQFGKTMKGYLSNNAVVHAPESRTSSPVRIPRDPESLEHIGIKGLYPAGEGAGYAGGIISAAIDGMNSARKCVGTM
ncbi:MAG: FAD-binding protein [Cyclobacteriaceae bacterium]|nr:FAD-binding protein [Cyclobacteriaceae bacterium]